MINEEEVINIFSKKQEDSLDLRQEDLQLEQYLYWRIQKLNQIHNLFANRPLIITKQIN